MKPAPEDSSKWKCSWLDCFHGMGLAGRGVCPGEWWKERCPHYILEEDQLKKWREKDATKNKDVSAGYHVLAGR